MMEFKCSGCLNQWVRIEDEDMDSRKWGCTLGIPCTGVITSCSHFKAKPKDYKDEYQVSEKSLEKKGQIYKQEPHETDENFANRLPFPDKPKAKENVR